MKRIIALLFLLGLQAVAAEAQQQQLVEKYINQMPDFTAAYLFTTPRYSISRRLDSLNVTVRQSADLLALLEAKLAEKVDAVCFDGLEASALDTCAQLLQQFPRLKFLAFKPWFRFEKQRVVSFALPPSIALLKGLQGISFSTGNKLDLRNATQTLAALPALTILSFNGYQGELPEHIDSLRQLRYIVFSTDHLTRTRLTNNLPWQEVHLITGKQPAGDLIGQLTQLPQLRSLKLNNCNADDLLQLASLQQLETLELRSVKKGKEPVLDKVLVKFTGLKKLAILYHTDSTETIQQLGKLKKLETLSLRSCAFLLRDASQLGVISSLQQLKTLEISGVPALPVRFGALKQLEVLVLDDNTYKELPEEICSLPALRQLSVTSHQLTALPDVPFRLSNYVFTKFDATQKYNQRLACYPISSNCKSRNWNGSLKHRFKEPTGVCF